MHILTRLYLIILLILSSCYAGSGEGDFLFEEPTPYLDVEPSIAATLSVQETDDLNRALLTKPHDRSNLDPSIPKSWDHLPRLTQETLKTFQDSNPKGVLLVHAIEDEGPNYTNPVFRTFDKSGRKVNQAFIDTYVTGYLALRHHIACSLISINSTEFYQPVTSPTYGSACLIISCDFDQIIATSLVDCYSHVSCHPEPNPGIYDPQWIKSVGTKLRTIKSMTTHPSYKRVISNHGDYALEMNEVVISCLAQLKDGTFKRPKVVGVLWNPVESKSANMGLGLRSLTWKPMLEQFAITQGLPFFCLPESQKHVFAMWEVARKLNVTISTLDILRKEHEENERGIHSKFPFSELMTESGCSQCQSLYSNMGNLRFYIEMAQAYARVYLRNI